MSTPRQTLRSCENCRAAKAKCVPSSASNTKDCERCIKFNKTCVYREPRPRTKRGKQAHTRVAEVEKKLDDLRILLRPYQEELQQEKSNAKDGVSHAANVVNTSESRRSDHHNVLTEICKVHKHRDRDVIDKEVLSEKEANQLLEVYLAASHGFPFVYISRSKTLDTLRDEKPFLLLAVLTVSSQRSRALQVLLEKEFRETLASKVIIEGELSLDVLQGLMLYLAWYHYNFRPARQQIYQLTQLCGSMVVDLELHKSIERRPGFVLHPSKGCMACKKDTAPRIASEAEGLRTFIGAYYLTASLHSISLMLRKPNGLTYTPYMEKCCKKLSELSEATTDKHLIHYVRLTRIADEISATFGYCAAEVDLELSHQRVQGIVRSLIAKAQDVDNEIPPEARDMPSIMSLLYTIPGLAYEIIFHLDARTDSTTVSTEEENWQTSNIRTDMFLALLDSVHKSLRWYMALPIEALEHLNLLDMARIHYNLLLLGRLTLSGYPGSGKIFESEVSKLNSYYEAIVDRYEQLDLLQNQKERSSIFWQLHDVINASKDWTMRKVAQRMADGENYDSGKSARMQPSFQIVSPWGIVDLEKGQVEVLDGGYAVAAMPEGAKSQIEASIL